MRSILQSADYGASLNSNIASSAVSNSRLGFGLRLSVNAMDGEDSTSRDRNETVLGSALIALVCVVPEKSSVFTPLLTTIIF